MIFISNNFYSNINCNYKTNYILSFLRYLYADQILRNKETSFIGKENREKSFLDVLLVLNQK